VEPERLRSLPLFSSLSDEECWELAPLAYEYTVAPGQPIVREGDQAWEFFVILDGTATVERDGAPIARLGAGDFFGEVALIETERRIASVRATGEVQVLVIPSEDFEALVTEKPAIAEHVRDALRRRVRETLGTDTS
jgi:CRP/FNR family transcriptional regulator, cyclic AMP receptor protein